MNDSIRQAQADTRDEAALPPLPVTLWPKLAAAQRRRRILLQYGLRTAGLVTTLVLVAGIALLVDPPGREADPALPGEMKVTVDLKAVSVGTEVHIEQQGVPDVVPAEACYLGWQESLRKLAKLVEPEINQ